MKWMSTMPNYAQIMQCLPLCICLSAIDQFGDHLLGCSHGSLYIQHHDALVSVVHHTLLQDPPDVLHEQDTSTSDCSHPEDTYHPNFLPWSPCLLWPLRCTTQSATMSAAPQAGSLTSLEANCLWIFWHLDIISIINPIYNYWQIYD